MALFAKLVGCVIVVQLCINCNTQQKFPTGNQNDSRKPRGIWVTEWSADGEYFALGGDDSTLWVYKAMDYSLLKTYKLSSLIRGLRWHPKENLLAIATGSGIQLLDFNKDQLSTFSSVSIGGRGIAWNASGELLALADGAGVVQILNRKGELLRSISKHNSNSYLAVDWHPTKNIILTSSDEIILFDTTGKQLQFIKHRKESTGILSVRWHPSGDFFASGDYGHHGEGIPTLLQFWKEDGTLIKTIEGHMEEIRNLRWSRNGNMLATAADGLRIFNKDGQLLHHGKTVENLWGVAWSKDDQIIVTGSFANGSVKIWNNRADLIKEIQ